jgi:zinc transport system ATP-binding protein
MSDLAIQAHNLAAGFAGHTALDQVTFELPVGSFLAIVGPNGSGKSTLLRVLMALLEPRAGQVSLFDKPVRDIPPTWLGYVPQLKTLDRRFPALGRELVATGLQRRWPVWIGREDRAKIRAALDQVGAAHLQDRPVAEISGGELQRIYLARALVHRPRIVLLDEPATGIDVKGEHDFYDLLDDYHRETNATILMVTHDWHAAIHHASHVLLLKTQQVAFGPPRAALADQHIRTAFGHVGHRHHEQDVIKAAEGA